jgi:hypothetical protein
VSELLINHRPSDLRGENIYLIFNSFIIFLRSVSAGAVAQERKVQEVNLIGREMEEGGRGLICSGYFREIYLDEMRKTMEPGIVVGPRTQI